MKIYKKDLQVPLFQTDKYGKMTAVDILKYLGELSSLHNMEAGNKNQELLKGYGWMLNKWRVKLTDYPKGLDRICIKTWISKVDRFFVNRDFIFTDEDGRELVRASSLWIFIDMEKRRPARIKNGLIDQSLLVDLGAGLEFRKFKRNLDLENSILFKIRRSDIDSNQHVNNASYLSWMLESVDDEIVGNYELTEFEIDYRLELTYPGTVDSRNQALYKDSGLEILHGIYGSRDSSLHSLGLSKWKKKPVR